MRGKKIGALLVLLYSISSFGGPRTDDLGLYPFWVLGGIELGVQEKTKIEVPEVANGGFQMGLKLNVASYTDLSVWEFGGGFRTDSMKRNDVEVDTKALFGEFGFRMRLSERWSLGPHAQILYGQDVSFSDIGSNSDNKTTSLFYGARLMYDLQDKQDGTLIRIGVQSLSDLDIANRTISYHQLIIEYGFPIGTKSPRPEQVPIARTLPPPPKVVVVEKLDEVKEDEPAIRLNLKEAGVTFATGSTKLIGVSAEIIRKLAHILSVYNHEWDKIKIFGHTDKVGDPEKNLILSRQRADSVKQVFIEFGVIEEKIISQGFGSDKPIDDRDTAEAYATNRRVELNIISENASVEFAEKIKKVLDATN